MKRKILVLAAMAAMVIGGITLRASETELKPADDVFWENRDDYYDQDNQCWFQCMIDHSSSCPYEYDSPFQC